MKRRVLTLLLCLCVLTAALTATGGLLSTAAVSGTVCVDDFLNVRSGPGTGNAVIGRLYNGDRVTVEDTTLSGSMKWYKITAGSLSGYVSADYVTLDASYQTDEAFESYLTAQGFPESYKVSLRQIHAQYPSWVFKAQLLPMTWETAFSAECTVGTNTIQSPDSWKSMEKGAYNWDTGSYVVFDSGGWVSAYPGVIAYYMDPRTFLNSTYIFQFEELSYAADHTLEGVQAILPGALDPFAGDVLNASRNSGVSAYFLASRMTQEGTHLNGLGTGTVPGYEGYYNFFDYGAYAHDGKSAVENGAIYAKSHDWNTPYKCILDSAKQIGSTYINLGQNTFYYQKFNVTNTQSGLYRHQYMTNITAAASEGAIRHNAASAEQLKAALTFRIPVYSNMPDTPTPRPSTTGNNDNTLTAINAGGCGLTPSFTRYGTWYAADVAAEVSNLTISATASGSGARVDGGGTVALNPGVNTVTLTVTATSGVTRIYTLVITREGGGGTVVPSGDRYTVNGTVTRVEPGTGVESFLGAFSVPGGTVGLLCSDGAAKTQGTVATGDILCAYSGSTLCGSFPVVIYGDVNGDGLVNSLDLRITRKHILEVAALNGYPLTAADSNRDGQINSLDLRITRKFILGITQSLQ